MPLIHQALKSPGKPSPAQPSPVIMMVPAAGHGAAQTAGQQARLSGVRHVRPCHRLALPLRSGTRLPAANIAQVHSLPLSR
jgi:hypothetical protein